MGKCFGKEEKSDEEDTTELDKTKKK